MSTDSQNVIGLSHIINKAHAKPDVDYNDIEQFLANSDTAVRNDDRYDREIEEHAKRAGIDLSVFKTESEPPRVRFEEPAPTPTYTPTPSYSAPTPSESSYDYSKPSQSNYEYRTPAVSTNFTQYTQEQIKRNEINGVLSNMGSERNSVWSIEKEKTEDSKSTMLEKIDSLRDQLEEDGVDVSRIPFVTQESDIKEVESVLRVLQLKNDRMRYCSFAEEFLMFGAYGLEELFNGENIWFGKYQPDLRGWHTQVAVKLRRMRHDTSSLVSSIMQDYNMGSASRIMLELVPSAFMYSKTRKQQSESKMYSDESLSSSINSIRDITERK